MLRMMLRVLESTSAFYRAGLAGSQCYRILVALAQFIDVKSRVPLFWSNFLSSAVAWASYAHMGRSFEKALGFLRKARGVSQRSLCETLGCQQGRRTLKGLSAYYLHVFGARCSPESCEPRSLKRAQWAGMPSSARSDSYTSDPAI